MKNSNEASTAVRGQRVVIAIIVALAIAAGAAILRSGKSGAAPGPSQAAASDGHGHDDHDDGNGNGERKAEAPRSGTGPEDVHAHGGAPRATRTEAGAAAGGGRETARAPAGGQAGKVGFTDRQIASSGVSIDSAGPSRIAATVQLPGEIRFNDDRTAHVVPRVQGVVESVSADLGQQVRKGQVLAVLSSAGVSDQRSELMAAQKRLALAKVTADREWRLFEDKISAQQDFLQAEQAQREAEIAVANATQKLRAIGAAVGSGSLSRYELRAPFDGMVVEKHLSLGESVREDAQVFTISDLATVWAQISVSASNLGLVRVGEEVTIRATGFEKSATGKVSYVGSLLGEQTRTAIARVTLANPNLAWRPGLFVTVELVSGKSDAPVTVSADAIQTVEDKPTVFAKVDGGFEARAVRIGRSDGKRVEILGGLEPGAQHAGRNSFAVKAQMGKGSSGHEH